MAITMKGPNDFGGIDFIADYLSDLENLPTQTKSGSGIKLIPDGDPCIKIGDTTHYLNNQTRKPSEFTGTVPSYSMCIVVGVQGNTSLYILNSDGIWALCRIIDYGGNSK